MSTVTTVIASFLSTSEGSRTGLSSKELRRRLENAGYRGTLTGSDVEAVKRSLKRISQYRIASTGNSDIPSLRTASVDEVEKQAQDGEILQIAICPLCRRPTTPNVRLAGGITVDLCKPCRLPIPQVRVERK